MTLREHVLGLLSGSNAHVTAEEALADFPAEVRGTRPAGCPHSAWQLLEHLRIAQWDILQYCLGADYRSPAWPAGYWPASVAPPDEPAWQRSVAAFLADLEAVRSRAADPACDLLAPLPHDPDVTWLHEICLIASHNAYHLGQLVLVRRMLGAWAADRRPLG